jgi:hypothetical protein
MPIKITKKDSYFLIKPSKGVDYLEILEAILKLTSSEKYIGKHGIWHFEEGPMNFEVGDIDRIKKLISEAYPDDTPYSKIALVSNSELHVQLAHSFIKIAETLPFEFMYFTEIESAEFWVRENTVQKQSAI